MTGIETLREIGSQKISEQTHIAKKFVEDILNENFDSMNKIQFAGFISILEREYGVDLHAQSEAYKAKFSTSESTTEEPFVVSAQENEKQSSSKNIYIAGGLVAAGIILAVLNFTNSSENVKKVEKEITETSTQPVSEVLDSTTIQEAKVNLNHLGNTTVTVEQPAQGAHAEAPGWECQGVSATARGNGRGRALDLQEEGPGYLRREGLHRLAAIEGLRYVERSPQAGR